MSNNPKKFESLDDVLKFLGKSPKKAHGATVVAKIKYEQIGFDTTATISHVGYNNSSRVGRVGIAVGTRIATGSLYSAGIDGWYGLDQLLGSVDDDGLDINSILFKFA
ncbi:MAG: hypothetical protein ACI9SY_000410 [Candidatus Paceibacteria bacterium]|jgi:hypothetical protein